MNSEIVGLYASIPVACFRVPRAREYFETYPVPPPATVYGMLLSLVGETNRFIHEKSEIAIALISEPSYSTVLRTLWRVKNKNEGLGAGGNRRPDYQELLTDVQLAVWIRKGVNELPEVSLAQRVFDAMNDPTKVFRFGGLSLGESTHLVDEIKLLDNKRIESCQLLLNNPEGDLSLPVWADHVGANSLWGQYYLSDFKINGSAAIPADAWTTISRRELKFQPSQTLDSQQNLF